MFLKFKRMSERVCSPERKTDEAAGFDLAVAKDYVFEAGDTSVIKCETGIAVELDVSDETASKKQYALMLYARSSLCNRGLILANGVGVIDSDYRGEIRVPLINVSGKRVELKAGERVAQLVVQRVYTPEIKEVDILNDTARGAGGFGSTGV